MGRHPADFWTPHWADSYYWMRVPFSLSFSLPFFFHKLGNCVLTIKERCFVISLVASTVKRFQEFLVCFSSTDNSSAFFWHFFSCVSVWTCEKLSVYKAKVAFLFLKLTNGAGLLVHLFNGNWLRRMWKLSFLNRLFHACLDVLILKCQPVLDSSFSWEHIICWNCWGLNLKIDFSTVYKRRNVDQLM